MHAVTEPAWIAALRSYSLQHGQGKAGAKIGYTGSVVSALLKGTYKGNLKRVQEAVEGALMGLTVECPVVGDIPRQSCVAHQRRASDPKATNPMRIQLAEACPKCEHASANAGQAGKEPTP